MFRALRALLLFLLAAVVFDFVLSRFSGTWSRWFDHHYIAIAASIPLLVLSLLRFTYFSYDDSYEILHIHSRSLFSPGLHGKGPVRYEFPKRKVVGFSINEGFLHRKLTLVLETDGGERRKQIRTVDMTLLGKASVRRVIRSLSRITQQNALSPALER